jgi:hypothetical protein
MPMIRLNIQIPCHLKEQLDALRAQGTSASGYIRWLLERELKNNLKNNERKGSHGS